MEKKKELNANPQEETTLFGVRYDKGLKVAMAYDDNEVQYISYEKLIEVFENARDTRVVENFVEASNGVGGRGQLLATYDKDKSKVVFVRGLTGRIIRKNSHVVYRWEFPVEKTDLELYVNLAKYEVENKVALDDKISNFHAIAEYDITLHCK